jgi:GntR family transcriptional regulator
MQLRLDFQDRVPIYTQIVDQVLHLVAGGVLRPGDQLPTVRELAADLRVNFNTVARAYRILHEERVISTQQGRGTYVLGPPPAEQSAQIRGQRLQELVQSWLAEAERLGYSSAEVGAAWETSYAEWSDGRAGANEPGR